MDIGEVAKKSGVKPSALRFYEEKGLITSLGRKGLRRYYAEDVLERLSLIALGRSAGLSLGEIGMMLLPTGLEVDRSLLLSKADQLDKQITEMIAMRDGLRHAAACEAENHLACPKFQRLMKVAKKLVIRK